MKKRLFLTFLLFCVVTLTLLFSVSCDCKHSFEEWNTVKDATCTENGIKISNCSKCQLSKTESIPAKGHTEVTLDGVNSTCIEAGLSEGKKCSVCDFIIQKQISLKLIEHNYINGYCVICKSEFYSKGLSFTLNEDKDAYSVSKGSCYESNVVIPNTYKGLPVTAIAKNGFTNCSAMKSIYIPTSVVEIPSGAFKGCSSLKDITIPFVGENANATSSSASTLFGVIFGDTSYSNSTKASQNYGIISSKTYYIPTSLESVTVLGGNLYFGAFDECKTLKTIVLPSNLTEIPKYTFYECEALTEIKIPSNVTSIGDGTFSYCDALTKIDVAEGNTAYKSKDGVLYSFDLSSLIKYPAGNSSTSFIIPNTVVTIKESAFRSAKNLTSIIIPDSVNIIEAGAFWSCSSLLSIIIPNGVTAIEDSTFLYCSSLTTVVLPSNLALIGTYAFQNCDALKTVTIPSTVTEIGKYAFSFNDSLESIIIPISVKVVGERIFSGSSINYIYCEANAPGIDWDEEWAKGVSAEINWKYSH